MRNETGANLDPFHLAEFKREGIGDVGLLNLCLAQVKLARLAVMIGKGF
jgi:hypothetical protein